MCLSLIVHDGRLFIRMILNEIFFIKILLDISLLWKIFILVCVIGVKGKGKELLRKK